MLAHYLDVAMQMARYEIIEDDGAYWGEIPGLQGLWARHETLAGCQRAPPKGTQNPGRIRSNGRNRCRGQGESGDAASR